MVLTPPLVNLHTSATLEVSFNKDLVLCIQEKYEVFSFSAQPSRCSYPTGLNTLQALVLSSINLQLILEK